MISIKNNFNIIAVCLFLIAQIFIGIAIKNNINFENLSIMPPSKLAMKIASGGDDEFFYRSNLLFLQSGGDKFAIQNNTEFAEKHLLNWLYALHSLNNSSLFLPYITMTYYAKPFYSNLQDILNFVIEANFIPKIQEEGNLAILKTIANIMLMNEFGNYETAFNNSFEFLQNQNLPFNLRANGLFIAFKKERYCDVLKFSSIFDGNAYNIAKQGDADLELVKFGIERANHIISIAQTKCNE